MNLVTGIVVYICIWWLVFFIVLSIKQRMPIAESVELGHAPSAPVKPRIFLRMVITSIISAFLWLGTYYIIVHWLLPQ